MAEITALIRFKNSAATLPEVLKALQQQSRPVDRILAIDTGSSDASSDLLRSAGAAVIEWNQPYHHSMVLNFGMQHCTTPLVLCLSSHTVMQDANTVELLCRDVEDLTVCASSIKWDNDPYYSDHINWDELCEKGLKFGSIYSNSLGLLKRANWANCPFDESINGMEDYDWALRNLRSGQHICRRNVAFNYHRNGHNRLIRYTALTFFIAQRYELSVTWLGHASSIKIIALNLPGLLLGRTAATATFKTSMRRLIGALCWKFFDPNKG
ncbi:MAG: glycosyltransferase involved in cell wall biosynthesis [Lentimonas sp.]|jgi:glycosyltransferase involved in cell wall biosynthesis